MIGPQVERRLREVAKRDAGKGVILRHLNMANRMSGVAGAIKGVFMNAVVKSTSKLLTSEQWVGMDLATVLQVNREMFGLKKALFLFNFLCQDC